MEHEQFETENNTFKCLECSTRIKVEVAEKILEPKSLLIFDCGANTKENKKKILGAGFNFLTLKPKKRLVYKTFIKKFNDSGKTEIEINNQKYSCVKVKDESQVNYVFFSEKLEKTQLNKKKSKFERELKKKRVKIVKSKKRKRTGKISFKRRMDCYNWSFAKNDQRN